MKRALLLAVIVSLTICNSLSAKDGWKTLFDGKTMNGWKASENTDSWSVKDGALVCAGPRSHLFYVGEDKPFKDFEFECEVMTTPGSNAGLPVSVLREFSAPPQELIDVMEDELNG